MTLNATMVGTVALRAALIVGTVGWGISLFAVVLPDDAAFAVLSRLAGEDIAPSPMLGYWLRMAGLAFVFIGCLFAWCAIAPLRAPGLTRALLAFNLVSGLSYIIVGSVYGLDQHPYLADGMFGLSTCPAD